MMQEIAIDAIMLIQAVYANPHGMACQTMIMCNI